MEATHADPDSSLDDDSNTQNIVSNKIRWIYFQLGCAVLLPWNAMITATSFFLSRLSGSHLKTIFPSVLSSSFTLANFVFLAYTTVTAKNSSPSGRIFRSTIWLSIMALVLTSLTFVQVAPEVFFGLVIAIGVCQALGSSYLQTSVVAVAALFGHHAVQSVMAGQAAVAVAVSLVQVASATVSVWGQSPDQIKAYVAGGDGSEAQSALIFFALSTVFFLATSISHMALIRMPDYIKVTSRSTRKDDGNSEERQRLVSRPAHENTYHDEGNSIWRVTKANINYEVAVAMCFIVTLAVFPPITATVTPTNPNIHPLLFSSLHFLVFNAGDLAGRKLCSYPLFLVWSDRRLLAFSFARIIFIPLFLLCNVQGRMYALPDAIFMLILLAFGISNGWLGSLCMMGAPSIEHNPRLRGRREDVETAAAVATFCLVGGLVIGSSASFGVQAIICRCNPFLY